MCIRPLVRILNHLCLVVLIPRLLLLLLLGLTLRGLGGFCVELLWL